MTTEEIVISIVRLIGALFVLRWFVAGAIIAILIDFSDLFLMNLLQLGGVQDYLSLDKWLDLSYMGTFFYVSTKKIQSSKYVSLGLFTFRLIGLLLFEITGYRWILLAFPNFFEVWFVISSIAIQKKQFKFNSKWGISLILAAFLLKLLQEYVLHGARLLDKYRAIDVVENIWQFVLQLL